MDLAQLAAFVGEKLAYYLQGPSHWELRDELPRDATGKVLKHVLAGEAESTFVDE